MAAVLTGPRTRPLDSDVTEEVELRLGALFTHCSARLGVCHSVLSIHRLNLTVAINVFTTQRNKKVTEMF